MITLPEKSISSITGQKPSPATIPRYTFVEKLQTISTKFRQQQEKGSSPADFMRHYYDVYQPARATEVQAFIGTEAYKAHKTKRFPKADNPNIRKTRPLFSVIRKRARRTKRRSRKQRSLLRTQTDFRTNPRANWSRSTGFSMGLGR